MDILKEALEFATKAHEGQVSESGHPYINHPIWVSNHLDNELDKVVGLLHDVLEDTDTKEEEILNIFGKEILDILKVITKNKDEDYLSYIERVKQNEVARRVKIMDLRHNMDLSRKDKNTDYDFFRLHNKYFPAYKMLTGHKLTLSEQLNNGLNDYEIYHLIWNLYSKRLIDDRINKNMYHILNEDSFAISDLLKAYIEEVLK